MQVLRHLPPSTQRNLALLFGSALCFWSSLTILLPTLPLYIEATGASQQQVGLVMGSFAIGLLLTRGILGRWADQRSRKLVILIGMAAVALVPLGYLRVQSLALLVLLRAVHGLSIAGLTTGYSTLVIDISPRDKRGEILGYMTLVVPFGMALGPAIGGFLGEEYGFGVVFLISAALGFVGFLGASQVQETPFAVSPSPGGRLSLRQLGAHLFAGYFTQLTYGRRLRVPALVLMLTGMVFGTLTTFLPAYVRNAEVALNAGLFYTAVAIASFSVRVFAGRASDRVGRGPFISCSLLSYILSMLLLARATTAVEFLLGAFAEGAGAGILIPMMTALVADRSLPKERGQAYAVCVGGFDLGIALGGPIAGTLVPLLGYRGIFGVAASLSTLAFLIFVTQTSPTTARSIRFALGRVADEYAREGS